jgi:hypothetical protein
MLAAHARRLLAALWAGSLWSVAYQAAMHFATLDRATAGSAAARLFAHQTWLTLFCAVALAGLVWVAAPIKLDPDRTLRRKLLALIAAAAACALVVRFGIQPAMSALREAAGPGAVMDAALRARFGILHGLASLVFLGEAVFASLLLLKMR